VKFLVDNQLPVALARFLEANGVESRHVLDLGLDEANDRTIWAYAKANGFTVVSKDEDFLHFSIFDPDGPALIWVRFGNCRKATLLAAFEAILPQLIAAVRAGQKIIEALERAGYRMIGKRQRFIVKGSYGPLRDGELERARQWGAELAKSEFFTA